MTDASQQSSEEQPLKGPAASAEPHPSESRGEGVRGAGSAASTFGALLEPFARPIPGARRGGENARYDPEHEGVRAEIDKLERPTAEDVDWDRVHALGRSLLTTKSKDYLIASYFGVACFVRGGAPGLIEALAALVALLESYWEDGFPPVNRQRARVNAINWFVERLVSLSDLAPIEVQSGDLRLLREATETLEALLRARFEDEMPSIQGLKEMVERVELRVQAEAQSAPAPEGDLVVDGSARTGAGEDAPPATEPAGARAVPSTELAQENTDPVASAESRCREIAAPFVAAIAGPYRAGESARHDPEHEMIRAEIDKLGKPTGEEPDWGLVERAALSVLTSKSKDLLIASYFGVASYIVHGVPGLITGLAALVAWLQDYWEDGFPPSGRQRARINAIDWFIDRIESLGSLAPETSGKGDSQVLRFAFEQLEQALRERFDDEAPDFHGLKRVLAAVEQAIPASAAPTPLEAPAQAPRSAPVEADASNEAREVVSVDLMSPSAELADPAEVDAFLSEVGDSLHKASRALFKVSKEDPVAYRLSRQGLYMAFTKAPPVHSASRTAVPPPPSDRAAQLETLLAMHNWALLLDEAESGLANARLWLDQHRYVALALGGLGFEEARDTVIIETAAIVRRLPELLEREFDDGQPFASVATRYWLDAERSNGGPTAGADGYEDEAPSALSDALADARTLAVDGELDEAVERLSELMQAATFGRDRFRVKLAMAEACASAGAPALAEGILAGLCEEIRDFRLEEWEPELAEACYRVRYEVLAPMANESSKSKEELIDVYRRLCRVSPISALELGRP